MECLEERNIVSFFLRLVFLRLTRVDYSTRNKTQKEPRHVHDNLEELLLDSEVPEYHESQQCLKVGSDSAASTETLCDWSAQGRSVVFKPAGCAVNKWSSRTSRNTKISISDPTPLLNRKSVACR